MNEIKELSKKIEDLKGLFEKTKGLEREFSPFVAVVQDNLDILITSISGFSVLYPAYSTTWVFLMSWIDSWSESDITMISNFVKGIVFPCAMRLSDVDAEYIKDITSAHERLTNRVSNNKIYDDGEEEQGVDEH